MLVVPQELTRRYEARLVQQNIVTGQRLHYHKWLRYYLDFCGKYNFAPTDRQSLPAFQEKLQAKHQPEPLCQQAGHAVSLYWEIVSSSPAKPHPLEKAATPPGVETQNAVRETLDRTSSRVPVEKPPVQSSALSSTPASSHPSAGK